MTAVLRLDPIADREEYAELARLVAEQPQGSLGGIGDESASPLAIRARNLGVDRRRSWSRASGVSIVDDLQSGDWRCLIVDLGSLDGREELVRFGAGLSEEGGGDVPATWAARQPRT